MKVTIYQSLSCNGVEIKVPENYTPEDVMKAIAEQVNTPYDYALASDDEIYWEEDDFGYIIEEE